MSTWSGQGISISNGTGKSGTPTHLSVFVYSVKHFLGHEFLQVRNRGLRTTPDEAPLKLGQIAAITLEAHVHLFVLSVIVGL